MTISIEEIDIKAKSATQCLTEAEYSVTLSTDVEISDTQWQSWIDSILAKDSIEFEKTTKRGKKRIINLRASLLELKLSQSHPNPVLEYRGTWNNDGTQLRPEQLIYLFEQVGARDIDLTHIHRQRLILTVPEEEDKVVESETASSV